MRSTSSAVTPHVASVSSRKAGFAIFQATCRMNTPTRTAPAASIHVSEGKKCAMATATATGIELIASERWCHALASVAGELSRLATAWVQR